MSSLLPRRARPALAALCAAALLAPLAGCNRGPDLKLVPVAGKVTYKGEPLKTGSVSFRPDASRGNSSTYEPAGAIDAEGNYTLVTADKPGAPPGWYKVGVVSTAEPDPNNLSAVPKSYIPRQYGRTDESGLEVEVVESPKPGQYDLNLTK